jgi:hypothetical protein
LNNPSFIKTAIQDVNTLIDLYEQGKIKIKIDSTYGYSKIGEAMKRMHSRLNVGKIILKPDSEIQPETTSEVQTVASAEQVKLISTEPLAVDTPSVVETVAKSEVTDSKPAQIDIPEPISA